MHPKNPSVRIIILNYNGETLLSECLPSIILSAERFSGRCIVTVLDNCSVDGSQTLVAEKFPEVEFVRADSNKILCSYNDYLKQIDEPFVILLNNDIKVEPDFAGELIEFLTDREDAFFAAPKVLSPEDGRYEGGKSKMELKHGLLWGTSRFEGYQAGVENGGFSMQTGFGAFRRERFLELGGYDDLYLPGTVEDADLCFRAWKRGWKGYYCPSSVVWHMGQTSFKKVFGSAGISRMNYRNLYLFVWKNIRSKRLLVHHIIWILPQLLMQLLRCRWQCWWGFWDAVRRLQDALKRRRTEALKPAVMTEQQIFDVSRGIK